MPSSPPYHEQLLDRLLVAAFGELDAAATALLREHLSWVEVAGGQTLMHEGEPGDSMYLSVSGRLRAYVREDDGSQRMVRELARGQVIGEMALFTDEPRSATVVAIRDSVLVRLDKPAFERLIAASPSVSRALTRQAIDRLRTERRPSAYAAPATIGLLPVSAGVDVPAFARALAAALGRHGRVAVVDATALHDAAGRPHDVALRLDEIEAAHDFVLLVGDDHASAWTRRCTRQCDEFLLVADAAAPPVLHAVETACLVERPPRTEAAQTLVLLHAADARCPRDTAAWLARRPLTDHVHIRPALEHDFARLARLLARKGVGLVLAGGGARGFAHLGVLRALQEQGIEVDCVGGTSMGAVMAVLAAADQPLERVMAVARRAFSHNPTGDFDWLPLVSLIKGARLKRALRDSVHELFGADIGLEDLWKNCFVVATNYSQAREELLAHGDLQRTLLASTAIPGALPPVVRDGDLLCDGGSFNNFPADAMRARRGIGLVIGVDLDARKPRRLDFDAVPGSWTLLRDRLRPRKARRYRLPTLSAYLLNVTILYSVSRQRQSRALCDLYFNPPLERVGLLDWRRFDGIVEQGHAHAREVLARPEAAPALRAAGCAATAPDRSCPGA
ncbi:MAG TPA: cyclic nucleotide-binding and patatin-like phospholipase domain-containing protein [Burkholderiaceae bacterium]|nr:cyclic nucleotide-binding and patatin-like phospholipase domain-containing protein [Burkholderiaceae bacterium]